MIGEERLKTAAVKQDGGRGVEQKQLQSTSVFTESQCENKSIKKHKSYTKFEMNVKLIFTFFE